MLIVSGLAALVSAFFVHPSLEYFGYIDFQVIALLFCMMAITVGLKQIGSFEVLSQFFLRKGKDIKKITLILVLLCFFVAMLVTNDVALLTMVPFTIAILDFASEKRMIFVIVLETIAANLGSMLTPVGNPQNLYLFSCYGLDGWGFIKITLPVTALSLLIIIGVSMLVRSQKINIVFDVETKIENKTQFSIFVGLFILCLLTVFGVLDYRINLAVAILTVLITDRDILKKIDYSLLLTFVCFFIFVGNVSRIEAVGSMAGHMIEGHELFASAILSQIISNVPAAVMLSAFTEDYRDLILGTNIGGLGTIIASLASLISYKLYASKPGADKKRYLLVFTGANFSLLLALLVFVEIIL